MNYFRFIKPLWGKKELRKQKGDKVQYLPNPDFVREIEGPDTHEGYFDAAFIQAKNEAGYNVYYFPNYPSRVPEGKKFISGRDIDVYQWVFCDMDLKDGVYASKEAFVETVSQFPVVPTKVIFSGNGVHVYWQIKDLDRETYMLLQFMLIQHFNTDHSVWTPLQLMRWPGSLNTKDPENFKQTEVYAPLSSGKAYKVGDLWPNLPDITQENKHKIQVHIAKLMGIYTVDLDRPDALVDDLPARFEDLCKQDEYIYDLFYKPEETYGDRSGADFALTNILYTHDFSREEALQVLYNTQKARSRSGQSHRAAYAAQSVDKVYGDRSTMRASSVASLRKQEKVIALGEPVGGPFYLDCLDKPWRRKQVLGIVAGPGVGKTSITLEIFKHMILNSPPDSEEIFLFFTLEMTEGEILERWDHLTGGDPKFDNRLFIFGNESADGTSRHLGLQEIYISIQDTRKYEGRPIAAIAIDHISILNRAIDVSDPKKPTFGVTPQLGFKTRAPKTVNLELPDICEKLKELAKSLDVFLIIQSQTTKVRAGEGDVALGSDAAFGTARFEWFVDFLITCWQPLVRVQHETPLRVLAWQYAKIRERGATDRVTRGQKNLLHYEINSGELRPLTTRELEIAHEYIQRANDARREAAKAGGQVVYSNSPATSAVQIGALDLGKKKS